MLVNIDDQSDEDLHEDLRFEYEQLRQEILHNMGASVQILNLVVLITGGVAGFVFS
jgi:hypothetical protein